MISNNPTEALLAQAWDDIAPARYTKREWLAVMRGDDLHYHPVVISDAGRVEAVVTVRDYSAARRVAEIGFDCGDMRNPRTVFQLARKVLADIISEGDIDFLLGYLDTANARGFRLSELLGFREVGRNEQSILVALTANEISSK